MCLCGWVIFLSNLLVLLFLQFLVRWSLNFSQILPVPSKMDTIYHVAIIHPQWFKDFCVFLASQPTSHVALYVLGIKSHFPSHGYQALYCKVGSSAEENLEFSVLQCPVHISCNIPGPEWNPTRSGLFYYVMQCARTWQAEQKRGKHAAILAASVSPLTELEVNVNFVIKWHVSLIICNVVKYGCIVWVNKYKIDCTFNSANLRMLSSLADLYFYLQLSSAAKKSGF